MFTDEEIRDLFRSMLRDYSIADEKEREDAAVRSFRVWFSRIHPSPYAYLTNFPDGEEFLTTDFFDMDEAVEQEADEDGCEVVPLYGGIPFEWMTEK